MRLEHSITDNTTGGAPPKASTSETVWFTEITHPVKKETVFRPAYDDRVFGCYIELFCDEYDTAKANSMNSAMDTKTQVISTLNFIQLLNDGIQLNNN